MDTTKDRTRLCEGRAFLVEHMMVSDKNFLDKVMTAASAHGYSTEPQRCLRTTGFLLTCCTVSDRHHRTRAPVVRPPDRSCPSEYHSP